MLQQRNPRLPQVNGTSIAFSFAAARGEARADDLLCVTGHGGTDLMFRKTANAPFFYATNPDLNANGSVRALLQNGTILRIEAHEIGSLGGPPEYTELQNQGT